ncbi:alpha-D-ribose 1-methylphosphonate 5-triphosphate diphosphatase [Bosea sp. RAF48]|uniref:alpha-D-ribose 1-methylphosphonate 5-triphosphate diphosphatase n=1 Tax=Bosea sp. RAF48 TaxID=3237480 RepID=UPI003F916B77
MSTKITGVRALLDELAATDVSLEGGLIASLGEASHTADLVLHAEGCLLLPGIVDCHGDAFERHIMPRPGVAFDIDLALRDADRALLASGITTAFHGVTWSWEPGLRSAENARRLVERIATLKPELGADTRFHMRHETFNLDAEEEIASWLAEAARKAGVPTMSHDDMSPGMRRQHRALGIAIAEFPINEATAREAASAGEAIVFGAPNVLRGGSHTGCPAAEEMVRQGLCTILASDYYYPALALAPFLLAESGAASFATAWTLVSENPAAVLGLTDRGRITPGLRADLVIVRPAPTPRVVATIAGGRLVHLADPSLLGW